MGTTHGQQMLAVGGLNQNKELVPEVELFDTKTKTWKLDKNRSIAYPTKSILDFNFTKLFCI